MGTNLRAILNMNARRSSKQDSEVDLAASIMNFMKPRCLCASSTGKMRKKQFHPQEKKHSPLKNTGLQIQLVTLEEWILASPCRNDQGDHQFQFSKQASKRVHPTIDRGRTLKEGCLSKSRVSFSIERSPPMRLDRVERGEIEDSSLCRTPSVKLKKKVSFRLPEVADVFILDSPE